MNVWGQGVGARWGARCALNTAQAGTPAEAISGGAHRRRQTTPKEMACRCVRQS